MEDEVIVQKRLHILKIHNTNHFENKVGMKNIRFSMFIFATGKVVVQLTNVGQKL
jgi:hypothetical protein